MSLKKHSIPSKKWLNSLPLSQMVYPESFQDRIKYVFWRLYTPLHPYVRNTALYLNLVRHRGRQDYVIGKISPKQSFKELIAHLLKKDFAVHFVAWEDEGELLSLRHTKHFAYQYHLRIFRDGEIRGHFEYTPECYPWRHLQDVGLKDCKDYFSQILGHRIIRD